MARPPTSFIHVSEDEVTSGLEFARTKHGLYLDRDLLRLLANRTGELALENGGDRYAAKQKALGGNLPSKTKESEARRKAYSAAISHILGNRATPMNKARAKPKRDTAADQPPKPQNIPTYLDPRGQYTMIL